jgi:hypothetical protein
MNAESMKKIGFALMSLGFLAGALFLVRHPGYVEWLPYGVSFAVTAVGATLLRLSQTRESGETEKVSADMATIQTSLGSLVDKVKQLNADDRSGDKLFDVCKRIDAECMDPINDFVEAREAMIAKHGLTTYAEMMDSFALGERALNRAWCASADGYIDEVNRCLDRAEKHLGKALAVVRGTS